MTASFSRVNYSRASRAAHFFLFLLTRAGQKRRAANIFPAPLSTQFSMNSTTIESALAAALFRSCFDATRADVSLPFASRFPLCPVALFNCFLPRVYQRIDSYDAGKLSSPTDTWRYDATLRLIEAHGSGKCDATPTQAFTLIRGRYVLTRLGPVWARNAWDSAVETVSRTMENVVQLPAIFAVSKQKREPIPLSNCRTFAGRKFSPMETGPRESWRGGNFTA